MKIDYHIHTALCGHATGEMREYVESAIKKGIKEMGFSDHFPLPYQPHFSVSIKEISMNEVDIPYYMESITQLQKEFKDLILIKKGFEIDFLLKNSLFVEKYLYLYDELDYTIASVHFLNNWGIDQSAFSFNFEKYGYEKVWEMYIENLILMIKKYYRYIDILAHIDLLKKYGSQLPKKLIDKFKKVLELIKNYDLTIEINSSGIDKSKFKEQYPSDEILQLINEFNIDVTFGSDAHSPKEVGRYFDNLIEKLKNIGFKRLTLFTQHKKEYLKI